MTETIGVQAIVGPDQDQGLAQIETDSNVISVGNMIISQMTVPTSRERKRIRTTSTDAST